MIVRDSYGIIGQHSKEDPTYLDFGDSACRTGIMAMCGSAEDKVLMADFVTAISKDRTLVRHPYQSQWNDPALTSRDQVIGFFAGLSQMSYSDSGGTGRKAKVIFSAMRYARSWKVNKDILMPVDKLYLYKCAGISAPLWLQVAGYLNLAINLIVNSTIAKNEEQNQFICQCIVFGRGWLKAFVVLHPSVPRNLTEYWGGWRDQIEIGNAMYDKILKVLG